ncbi:unnamed protein product [Discosporangium mesarthrocarpum]
MADDQEERREIEAYLNQHSLQAFLGDAVNEVVKERPEDPLVSLADALRASSKSSRQILGVLARQVVNTEALPALEVEILTSQGIFSAVVSPGSFDDFEEEKEGEGLLKATDSVNTVLAEKLLGVDTTQQAVIDQLLTQEPGVPANAILATSIACCKAGAKHSALELFDHISILGNIAEGAVALPSVSILNGGQLAPGVLWVKDVLLVPLEATAISGCITIFSAVHRALSRAAEVGGQRLIRGPRGGFSCPVGSFDELVACVLSAINACGLEDQIGLAVDVHASRLFTTTVDDVTGDENCFYNLAKFDPGADAHPISKEDLLDMYTDWLQKYPIRTIVEPFAAVDSQTTKELLARGQELLEAKFPEAGGGQEEGEATSAQGNQPEKVAEAGGTPSGLGGDEKFILQIVADAGISTITDITSANEQRAANAIFLSLGKGATVSGCIALATKARELGWGIVVGGTGDNEGSPDHFVADFATGLRAGQIHLEGLGSASAVAACCQMLRMEGRGVKCPGPMFRA